jgi:hypothetical protein
MTQKLKKLISGLTDAAAIEDAANKKAAKAADNRA